jgi:muramoyltetrapeptide carboxypeptidase
MADGDIRSPDRRRGMGVLAGAVAGALMPATASAHTAAPGRRKVIKPPRLREGDLIALIAPAGHTNEDEITRAIANVEAMGFRVQLGEHIREVEGNYAGPVAHRLHDLHKAFADPEVKAVWCIRGGSGAISLLAHIDYKLIARHPKILVGYSDITALHLAIHSQTGLVTFHGPVPVSNMSNYTRENLLAVLMDPQPNYTIAMSAENATKALTQSHYAIRTVHGGTATGRLIGGNLSLVSALVGTPYAADYRDSLLFLEDVNEAPYRIDRWMTQLDLATGFDKAAGLIIGVCDRCTGDKEDITLTLDQTLDIHLQPLRIPAVAGYSIGHIHNQFTVPIGLRATLDTARQTITLLEPAVV